MPEMGEGDASVELGPDLNGNMESQCGDLEGVITIIDCRNTERWSVSDLKNSGSCLQITEPLGMGKMGRLPGC